LNGPQGIFWKPGKSSKFQRINSTILIWTDFHGNEAKNNIFGKKKIKTADSKKTEFFQMANSQIFFAKISQV